MAAQAIALALCWPALQACAPLACRYHRPKTLVGNAAPAHLEISVWSESDSKQSPVAEVVLEVAAGLIGTRKNYLITDKKIEKSGVRTSCSDLSRAWLRLEVREALQNAQDRASVVIVADLVNCETGATLWHAERRNVARIKDPSLTALTRSVQEQLGDSATFWTAPAFVTLQPLIEDMPNCVLTDEEVLERIELGSLRGPSFG